MVAPVRRANRNLTKNNPNKVFIFYNEAGVIERKGNHKGLPLQKGVDFK